MRICFLAPATSAHVIKWCRYFTGRGHEVHVISFTDGKIPGTAVHYIDSQAGVSSSDLRKLSYLTRVFKIRKIVSQIQPDIINAHYATSYGTVAALAGMKNYIVSVWGSDVYDFPRKSRLHRLLLQFSLRRASYLFSTSHAMAKEAEKYTDKEFIITPFGVDTKLFTPEKRSRRDKKFVIGTIKGLYYKYGIDYLLKAAAILKKEHPEIPLLVRIAGKGEGEAVFHQLAERLGLASVVEWLGFISQEQAALEWANMDLAIIPSSDESESFGVAAVEAQSCGCPVIISDIPGLMEATQPGDTSVVVPRKNAEKLAEAIFNLYCEPEKRKNMGENGRQYVMDRYEYEHCFHKIEEEFETVINCKKHRV